MSQSGKVSFGVSGLGWRMLAAVAIIPLASDELTTMLQRVGVRGPVPLLIIDILAVFILFAIMVGSEAGVRRRIDAARRDSLLKLQESEARARLQLERMPIACITLDCHRIVTDWNPAAERIFGYSRTEIVGRDIDRIFSGGMTEELQVRWQMHLRGEIAPQRIGQNLTKSGRMVDCRWTITPLVELDGMVTGVLVMAEDITEKLRSQRELHAAEARYRQVLDQLPHFVFSVDNELRYTAANAATCAFFGRAEDEIVGKNALELGVDPALAEQWKEQVETTRSSGVRQTRDLVLPTGDSIGWFRAITDPVVDGIGAMIGVTGISIDMTELKVSEAAANRLLRAVEQLDEVVMIADREGSISYVNPAFERVYGFTREETIGQPPRMLQSSSFGREQYAAIWSDLREGRNVRLDHTTRRKNGRPVSIIGSATPLVDDDGVISGFIAVQQDVTEQKRAAEEQRRFNDRVGHFAKMESLGTLAGGLAHDFNNILGIILTHIELLSRKQEDPAIVSRVCGTVRQAVRRGAEVSRQILTFARRSEVKLESVNLTTLILELGSMISETFPRTIQVNLDLDPMLPELQADAGQIHQALLNLSVNARDAMPAGGELTIAAHLHSAATLQSLLPDAIAADYVSISVSDTGSGIDEETRGRIFEPFFTTKEKGHGTGLGLALVFGIANNHKGLVDVESKVGEGTTFRIYLPLLPTADALIQAPGSATIGGTETLLVIDDEPALLASVTSQLRAHGYSVHTAGNGVEAIQLCTQRRLIPDAVIMDLGMPKMGAAELLRELRRIAPNTPVLAMTGYVDPAVHASVVAAGVQRIIAKPFEIAELLRGLREMLAAVPA